MHRRISAAEVRRRMRENEALALERGQDPRLDARPLMRMVMEEIYREFGYNRRTAREASERFVETSFDRIGYRMTDEDYYRALERIHSEDNLSRLIDIDFDEHPIVYGEDIEILRYGS